MEVQSANDNSVPNSSEQPQHQLLTASVLSDPRTTAHGNGHWSSVPAVLAKHPWPPGALSHNEQDNRGRVTPGTLGDDRRVPWQGQQRRHSFARHPEVKKLWGNPSGQSTIHRMGRSRSVDSYRSDAWGADVRENETTPKNEEEANQSIRNFKTSPTIPDLGSLSVVLQPKGTAGQLPHQSAFEFAIKPFLDSNEIDSSIVNLPTPTESTLSMISSPTSVHTRLSAPPSIGDEFKVHELPRLTLVDKAKRQKTVNGQIRALTVQAALMRCAVILHNGRWDFAIYDRTETAESTEKYSKIAHIASRIALPLAKVIGDSSFEARSQYWIGRGEAGMGAWEVSLKAFQRAAEIKVAKEVSNAVHDMDDLDGWLERARIKTYHAGIARQSSCYKEENPENDQQGCIKMRANLSPVHLLGNKEKLEKDEQKRLQEAEYISSEEFLLPTQRALLRELLRNMSLENGGEQFAAGTMHAIDSPELRKVPETSSPVTPAEICSTQSSVILRDPNGSSHDRRNANVSSVDAKAQRASISTVHSAPSGAGGGSISVRLPTTFVNVSSSSV